MKKSYILIIIGEKISILCFKVFLILTLLGVHIWSFRMYSFSIIAVVAYNNSKNIIELRIFDE